MGELKGQKKAGAFAPAPSHGKNYSLVFSNDLGLPYKK